MRVSVILALSLFLITLAVSASSDGISSIAVVPAEPTEPDSVRIIVTGIFGCINTELVEHSYSIQGYSISIEVISLQPTICLPAIAPWEVTEEIGLLSAGHYSVTATLTDTSGTTHDSKGSYFFVAGQAVTSRGCIALRRDPFCPLDQFFYLEPDPGFEGYWLSGDNVLYLLFLLQHVSYHVEVNGYPGGSDFCPLLIIDSLVVLNPPVTLSIQDTTFGPPGDTVSTNINLDNTQSVEELRFSLTDSHDLLTTVNVRTTERTSGLSAVFQDSLGKVSISMYSQIDSVIAPGDGPILQILYAISPDAEICDTTLIEVSEAVIADENGDSYCLTTEEGTFIAWSCSTIVMGDLNQDCELNIIDVILLVRCFLEIADPSQCPWCVLDCNEDGEINILDAVCLVNIILDIYSPPSSPQITPAVIEYLQSIESHFSPGDFTRLMALVKPELKVPAEYSLSQNYPNPFNPTTSIQYSVVSDQSRPHLTLKIFNLLGQEVRTLVDGAKEPGYHTVTWDGRDDSGQEVASGVYFYRLTAGNFADTKRMVLMK